METLAGKVAFVTGRSRGMGTAIVRRLADQGVHVAFTYVADADAAEPWQVTFGRQVRGIFPFGLIDEVSRGGGTRPNGRTPPPGVFVGTQAALEHLPPAAGSSRSAAVGPSASQYPAWHSMR